MSISPLLQAAMWGVGGALVSELVALTAAIRTPSTWPWREHGWKLYSIVLAIRLSIGGMLSQALAVAGATTSALAYLVAGIAGPMVVTRLTAAAIPRVEVNTTSVTAPQVYREELAVLKSGLDGIDQGDTGGIRIADLEEKMRLLFERVDKELSIRREAEAEERRDVQQRLLHNMYQSGLSDAQRSSLISVWLSALGVAVILVGVSLGIFKTGSQGEIYASIITSLAGATINVVAAVLIVQTRQARQHLTDLVRMLRQDELATWGVAKALSAVSTIQDARMRDRLHGDLALRILDFNGAGSSGLDVSEAVKPAPEGSSSAP